MTDKQIHRANKKNYTIDRRKTSDGYEYIVQRDGTPVGSSGSREGAEGIIYGLTRFWQKAKQPEDVPEPEQTSMAGLQ